MPLTWDVSKIADHDEVTTLQTEQGAIWHPKTEALVWLSMSTGIATITEQNSDEVYARINLIERVRGAMLGTNGESLFIEPEDVRKHIGLRTNASRLTKSQFLNQFADHELNAAKRRYRKETAELV